MCQLAGGAGICYVAVAGDGAGVPAVERGGVGVCGAGRDDNKLLVGGRSGAEPGELFWMWKSMGSQADSASGEFSTEPIWAVRRAWERVGIGTGLLEQELRRRAKRRAGVGARGLWSSGLARRFLGPQPLEGQPLGSSSLKSRRPSGRRRRIPYCPFAPLVFASLPLYLWGPGALPLDKIPQSKLRRMLAVMDVPPSTYCPRPASARAFKKACVLLALAPVSA